MKIRFALLFLAVCAQAQAQYNVTFQLQQLPSYQAANTPVFIAGTFNNWKPDSTGFSTAGKTLSIKLPQGVYEFKFTRGSWQTGETGANGVAINNRTVTINRDTVIPVNIADWADHFTPVAKRSTASGNVHIIDTAFFMPQLNRHRRVWIYLPPGYAASHKKYPVLYMQDGQNVFDEATSFSGEWGVDEALDTLIHSTRACIVVAIDHGGEKRLNEYSPYNMEKYGAGDGDAYVDFIVNTLKPYIRKNYRAKNNRKHQAIAGSSMGGLISFYAMLKYPKAFGAAGVFSPAFWIAPQLNEAIAANTKKVNGRLYFYAGKQESETMVPDMLSVFMQLSKRSKAKMKTVIRTGGTHSESQWRQEFPLFYTWWMH